MPSEDLVWLEDYYLYSLLLVVYMFMFRFLMIFLFDLYASA